MYNSDWEHLMFHHRNNRMPKNMASPNFFLVIATYVRSSWLSPSLGPSPIKPLPWACRQSRKKSKSCNKCCRGEDGWHQVLFCLGFSFGLLSLPSWRSWRSVNYAGRSQVFYWLSRSIWTRPSPPATQHHLHFDVRATNGLRPAKSPSGIHGNMLDAQQFQRKMPWRNFNILLSIICAALGSVCTFQSPSKALFKYRKRPRKMNLRWPKYYFSWSLKGM